MRSFVCAVFVTSLSLFGQSATTPTGHWEGTIDLPQKQVRVAVDLVQSPDGKWAGSVGFPDLGGTAARLTSIIVKGAMCSRWKLFARLTALWRRMAAQSRASSFQPCCGACRCQCG